MAKDFGADLRHNIHDILKALLDLRLLEYIDKDSVLRHVGGIDTIKPIIDRNINAVLSEGRDLWERNYHYTLVRKKNKLEDIARRIKEKIY